MNTTTSPYISIATFIRPITMWIFQWHTHRLVNILSALDMPTMLALFRISLIRMQVTQRVYTKAVHHLNSKQRNRNVTLIVMNLSVRNNAALLIAIIIQWRSFNNALFAPKALTMLEIKLSEPEMTQQIVLTWSLMSILKIAVQCMIHV